MPKTAKNGPRKLTGVKFAPDLQVRIDAIASELSSRAGGVALTTSAIITEITKRGLDAIERELGLKKKTAA